MPKQSKQLAPEVTAYMAALGRKGGAVAGARRMTNLSATKRRAIARLGAEARWAKKKIKNA
jgi:hypothetical protein